MQVDVEDSLPGVCACVDDETIAVFGDAFLRGDLFRRAEEVTY